jgi:hypothetical protein
MHESPAGRIDPIPLGPYRRLQTETWDFQVPLERFE